MSDFELGDRVTFSAKLKRVARTARARRGVWLKRWEPIESGGVGVVVGVRTMSNGDLIWLGEEGASYWPTEHFTAVMIAHDLRRVPIFARLEDVTLIDRDSS